SPTPRSPSAWRSSSTRRSSSSPRRPSTPPATSTSPRSRMPTSSSRRCSAEGRAPYSPSPSWRSEERRVGNACRARWCAAPSSRRRHTIFSRDWSSDVCSSDLFADSTIALSLALFINAAILIVAAAAFHTSGNQHVAEIQDAYLLLTPLLGGGASAVFAIALLEIGRASCRERV